MSATMVHFVNAATPSGLFHGCVQRERARLGKKGGQAEKATEDIWSIIIRRHKECATKVGDEMGIVGLEKEHMDLKAVKMSRIQICDG